ncbi:hypothetical protein VEE44_17000 [Escherichia coli]|nr:hypothetical protein VEE44_17000 [Escherichia coli]
MHSIAPKTGIIAFNPGNLVDEVKYIEGAIMAARPNSIVTSLNELFNFIFLDAK